MGWREDGFHEWLDGLGARARRLGRWTLLTCGAAGFLMVIWLLSGG